jgi:hypothetical protein
VPYRSRVQPLARRQIAGWRLPDAVLVEVYLRLTEQLPAAPLALLIRAREPFDGMSYPFRLLDPANRLVEHHFTFSVIYAADKETLLVLRGAYVRTIA